MTDRNKQKELQACSPIPVNPELFNHQCNLPYGLETTHIYRAMSEFIEFIGFINQQLQTKKMSRLESFLMPANFSSIVGEFMSMSLPKYCPNLVKNQYHNGHPDLIPANTFINNAVQYSDRGLEIKSSRHLRGWQGHNPESVWLMVFCFNSNTSRDRLKNIEPKPFVFRAVYAAKLEIEDWNVSGRSATSRRTITASINKKGYRKMKENWIYEDASQL